MKINQYCSVCKKHLDMEVIPTDDGGDDGVIWLRCPECQGFLPKFSGESGTTDDKASTAVGPATTPAPADAEVAESAGTDVDLVTPATASEPEVAADVDPGAEATPATDDAHKTADEPEVEAEPIAEYAAQLAEADTESATPYRQTANYNVGDVIHHLAYDDIGVVVAKEDLPGGRKVAKVYFSGAGVVRLIEQATDGR